MPLPKGLPLCAMALDREAWAELKRQHPHHHHLVQRPQHGSDWDWENEFHQGLRRKT